MKSFVRDPVFIIQFCISVSKDIVEYKEGNKQDDNLSGRLFYAHIPTIVNMSCHV